jgi:amphi-Trp domain-containing protein
MMGQEVVLFKSEEKRSIEDIAGFLRELADTVAAQQVILQQGENEVTLNLPAQVTLEVKAEEEKKETRTERSLEVELEWIVGDESGTLTLG